MRKPSPLRLAIFERGLIQADVARAAFLSESRLSRIVNGRVKPTEWEKKNIANALGLQRDELPV